MELFSEMWFQLSLEAKKKTLSALTSLDDHYVLILERDSSAITYLQEKVKLLGLTSLLCSNLEQVHQLLSVRSHKITFVVSGLSLLTDEGFEFRKMVLNTNVEMPFLNFFSKEGDKNISTIFEQKQSEGLLFDLELYLPTGFINRYAPDEQWDEFLKKDLKSRLTSMANELKSRRSFLGVAKKLIVEAEEIILKLEGASDDKSLIDSLFSHIHTLKGGSSFLQPRNLEKFLHRFEDYVNKMKLAEIEVTSKRISRLLQGLDFAKELIRQFETDQHQINNEQELLNFFLSDQSEVAAVPREVDSAPVAKVNNEFTSNEASREATIKVPLSLLDRLLQISGEQTVVRNIINKLNKNLRARHSKDTELNEMFTHVEELNKLNSHFQLYLYELRKVSANEALSSINRVVRDTAMQLGKSINFEVVGADERIDTSLVDVINQSLIHLVRNSIDHGIESIDGRKAAGKKIPASLLIEFQVNNDSVVVNVKDDGRGLQSELIRKKAIAKGLIASSVAQSLRDHEVWDFIFHPGFSTSEKTTEYSGRGVGMGAVRENIERIGGVIRIESNQGKGCAFTLVLPNPKLVFITRCLFVKIAEETFGLMIQNIHRIAKLDTYKNDDIIEAGGGLLLKTGDQMIPLVTFESIFDHKKNSIEDLKKYQTCIVLKTEKSNEFVGLCVDAVFELEDTVVKTFTDYLSEASDRYGSMKYFFGTTYLGDGSVGLIFNVDGIVAGLNKTVK